MVCAFPWYAAVVEGPSFPPFWSQAAPGAQHGAAMATPSLLRQEPPGLGVSSALLFLQRADCTYGDQNPVSSGSSSHSEVSGEVIVSLSKSCLSPMNSIFPSQVCERRAWFLVAMLAEHAECVHSPAHSQTSRFKPPLPPASAPPALRMGLGLGWRQ